MEEIQRRLVIRGIAAGVVTYALFFVGHVLIHALYKIITTERGDPGWWQFILLELFVPAVATYAAYQGVAKIMKEFHAPTAFKVFVSLVIAAGAAIIFQGYDFYSPQDRLETWRGILVSVFVNAAASIVTAYTLTQRRVAVA